VLHELDLAAGRDHQRRPRRDDNRLHVRFSYAAVLNDPTTRQTKQPFFFVRLRNITKSTTLFEDFTFSNQAWQTVARRYRRIQVFAVR